MSCKEAIEILKMIYEAYEDEDTCVCKAAQMAITALELQDGNLYVRDVPGSLSIGLVNGNVYMEGYGE